MTGQVRLRPAADRDIDEQADYLFDQASPSVALRFRDAIQQSLLLLAAQPELGSRFRAADARLEGLRFWPARGFAEHVIFYRRANDDAIEVVRVLHGKRDLDPILAEQ